MRNPIFFIPIALLAACTSPYPLPVKVPTPELVSQELFRNDTAASILHYRKVWTDKYESLIRQDYGTSDLGYAGTLTALVAGVSGAVTTAWIGGGIAAATAIIPQRYQYLVQIENYRVAAHAVDCMYNKFITQEIPETFLDSKMVDILLPQDINQMMLKYKNDIGNAAYQYVQDVVYSLTIKQAAVKLLTPDTTQLKTALNAQNASQDAVKKNSEIINEKINGALRQGNTPGVYAIDDEEKRRIKALVSSVYQEKAKVVIEGMKECKAEVSG
ncbi:hypothetical protein [Enterobacter sp.]|uniref:hypothetical protein n=1 Tax=Enterobacter sp. TaxID=42895 RepID=UPI0029822899|nr:hypothetical protein [Enterobacter sp.]